MSVDGTCASFLCGFGPELGATRKQVVGTLRCTGCKGADPETLYCSAECQKKDWSYHRRFCGKESYTFHIELLDSKNPVITRTVDVPSWYSFKQFHIVIQYSFGPWQDCHLHEFRFPRNTTRRYNSDGDSLWIADQASMDAADDGPHIGNFNGSPPPRRAVEGKTKLRDVYGENGALRATVEKDGEVPPCIYLYDLGDNWEHKISFRGSKLARAARPLFSSAVGYGPAEDSGGVTGWERVKYAFSAAQPSKDQLELREWALRVTGHDEERDDPLAVEGGPYSPLKTPNVTVMNYEGRWENHSGDY